jgi:hypothetical protein
MDSNNLINTFAELFMSEPETPVPEMTAMDYEHKDDVQRDNKHLRLDGGCL